jgi:hypothetical protein
MTTRALVKAMCIEYKIICPHTLLPAFYVSSLNDAGGWKVFIENLAIRSNPHLPDEEIMTPRGIMRYIMAHEEKPVSKFDSRILASPSSFKPVEDAQTEIRETLKYKAAEFKRIDKIQSGWLYLPLSLIQTNTNLFATISQNLSDRCIFIFTEIRKSENTPRTNLCAERQTK